MKTTLALSWKALVSKIHPPLPLNRKDSQKLLRCLNASFKKQLDAEYPYRLEDSSSQTQAHLQSILVSPLFEAKSSRNRNSLLEREIRRNGAISAHGLQYWLRKPLDAFQQGVSAGAATLENAKLCLELQLKKCVAITARSGLTGGYQDGISDPTGTASVILSWLWSSGVEKSGQHMKDRQFISLIIPFLVIEQRYDVIFNWFTRSKKNQIHHHINEKAGQRMITGQSPAAQSAAILLSLVKSEYLYGAGLGAAMLHFNEYFSRRAVESSSPFPPGQKLFRPAGNFLVRELARPGIAEGVQEDILSSFIATSKEWTEEGRLTNVVLQVHHPKVPRPHLLVEYLKGLSMEKLGSLMVYQRHPLIHTSLKAAELLLAEGHESAAQWLMQATQTKFSDDIGVTATSGSQRKFRYGSTTLSKGGTANEEASHLQLLDTLSGR